MSDGEPVEATKPSDLGPALQKSLELVAKKKGEDMPNPLTLAKKILEIQKSVGVVKKKGFNREHNYKFLQIEDAVLAVNKLLASHDLLLIPTLQKQPDGRFYWETVPHTGGKGYIAKAVFEWKLEDALTGEFRLYDIPGEGYDTTDKGTAKAITASRKQAIIVIFQLAVGFDNEAQGPSGDREDAKAAQRAVVASKLTKGAVAGSQTAVDALSQLVAENKIKIDRPEEYNGHYIKVSGFLAPQVQQYFNDTAAKPFAAKGTVGSYWRLGAEYESDLVKLCEKLGIGIEG